MSPVEAMGVSGVFNDMIAKTVATWFASKQTH